ncbi:MAG TPA: ABC transporter ATP-binding protein, partial [Paenibacillus sp.]
DDAIIAGFGGEAIVTQMQVDDIADIVPRLVSSGLQVRSVQKVIPTLEQLFLEMTDGEGVE